MPAPALKFHREKLATQLLTWLMEQKTDELPRLVDIAAELVSPHPGYAVHHDDVWEAFRWLAAHHHIVEVHGTVSLHRGHRIVRIVTTGQVLKTADCPLVLPGVQVAA